MYFVDLPKPDSTEINTLATFSTEEEAIAWAMDNLGADENGMLCVISDDGSDEE